MLDRHFVFKYYPPDSSLATRGGKMKVMTEYKPTELLDKVDQSVLKLL